MFRSVSRFAAVGALVAAGLVSAAGPASAKVAYREPHISYVSPVNVPNGGDATVLVSYRCYGGAVGTHAWVSIKQGPKIKQGLPNEGKDAVAWYDTNWNYGVSPAGKTINCNGAWQNELFQLKPEAGSHALKTGWGFVQVCFYDSTANPNDETSTKGFTFNYQIHHVYVE